jgi:predicted dehydrogenase
MKTLIVGLGSVGRRHLRNLHALGEREILLLRSHRATLPEDDLAGLPVATSVAEALDFRPDAAVIATPTALHLEAALPLARAGCHLLLEKPVSHTLEGVAELQAAAANSGARILIGFQYRFHPAIRQVKRWLEAGAIGEPLAVRGQYAEYLPGWHPWEDHRQSYSTRPELGGGVILTLCHPLDYLCWFLGDVERVACAARSSAMLGLPVEDLADLMLVWRGGPAGQLHLDYVRRPSEHGFEVVGAGGAISWNQADGIARCYTAERDQWLSHTLPEGFERNSMFLEEMRHFRDVAAGMAEPECRLEAGVQVLRIALAALEASRTRRWVELASDDKREER